MAYKLYYYDIRGGAEPIRMILSYGGVQFEDIRAPMFPLPPKLPKEIKESKEQSVLFYFGNNNTSNVFVTVEGFGHETTWGTIPLMEFEGKKLNQSLTISRYFAKKFDLAGSNDFEAALCDEYVDTLIDYIKQVQSDDVNNYAAWLPILMEQDEVKRKGLEQEQKVKCKEQYMDKFEKIVNDNGGRFLVGNKLTWADIYLAHVLNSGELNHGVRFIDEYPALKALHDNVMRTPGIKEWMAKRPHTKL
ncbi:Glutathione S-transferase [Folsomia candida]|uniref:glutathione transferase n=1 Tax=Folsomia candida TaxID=158441 RepID=A0A226D8E6_FOLCA|nr:Glutathione S-transferase [Folsomia candida]